MLLALRDGIVEYPLVRDPFILVTPKGFELDTANVIASLRAMPLLRYERQQLIGRQIEAHLARQKLVFDERFEVGSHLALMAMVARRIGWAITTPLGYMRAARFHDDIVAHALPFADVTSDTVPSALTRRTRASTWGLVRDPRSP